MELLGESDADGDREALAEELGDTDALGERDAELDALGLSEAEGLRLEDGDVELPPPASLTATAIARASSSA